MNATINEALARKVLDVVNAGLVHGIGKPTPGQMCVEAAVCYALGEKHGDKPSCVGAAVRAFKINLNDAAWSSNAARTQGMRALSIAQLGSDTIDECAFSEYVVIETVKRILPLALRAAVKTLGDKKGAAIAATIPACENASDLASAKAAADSADAADAAYAAYAANAAADVAARAANAAADAAYAANAAADAAAYAAAYVAARAADAAAYAAAYVAARAADAAAYAAARAAADAAAYAAARAAADADEILTVAADIGLEALMACGSPGCEYLWLLEAA